MSSVFYLKQNDTRPSYVAQLLQDGSAVDLAGATVRFHMGSVVDAPATIVDASTGVVRYDWLATDTAVAGTYNAEFEVTFSDGAVETFPNKDYLQIVIGEKVA